MESNHMRFSTPPRTPLRRQHRLKGAQPSRAALSCTAARGGAENSKTAGAALSMRRKAADAENLAVFKEDNTAERESGALAAHGV